MYTTTQRSTLLPSFVLAFFLLFIASCSATPSNKTANILPTSTATHTVTVTSPLTLTPTQERLKTQVFGVHLTQTAQTPRSARSTNTRTPIPSPTAVPQIKTTAQTEPSISPKLVLQNYSGPWSPTENILAGIHRVAPNEGKLTLVAAPYFTMMPVAPDELTYQGSPFDYMVTWKPDGEWLLFGGPAELGPVGEVTTPWAIRPSGKELHRVVKNVGLERWQTIPGWLDAQTMILTDYNGGGSRAVHLLNFNRGQDIVTVNVEGTVYPGSSSGAPFEPDICGMGIGVVTLQQQPKMDVLTDSNHVVRIPSDGIDQQNPCHWTRFLAWRPGKESIIAISETLDTTDDSRITESHLLEWDLKTNKITQRIPGVVDAQYSPDGRWLAVVVLDKAALSSAQAIPGDVQPVLQIIDTAFNQVKISLPVVSVLDTLDYSTYTSQLAFSPDSRHIAFVTSGAIILSQEKSPAGVQPGKDFSLNVLDITSQMIIMSTLSRDTSPLLWSPEGGRLFYQMPDSTYAILTVPGSGRLILNLDSSRQITAYEWSFNGEYLSLQSLKNSDDQETDTFIFKTR